MKKLVFLSLSAVLLSGCGVLEFCAGTVVGFGAGYYTAKNYDITVYPPKIEIRRDKNSQSPSQVGQPSSNETNSTRVGG